METIELTKNNSEPLLVNYFENSEKNNEALVIVGGSGDDRNKFNNVANMVLDKVRSDVVTFSFRGVETQKEFPAIQQYHDLKELINFLVNNKGKKKIQIACTSMGAVSTTLVAVDKKFNKYLGKIIFLDPADYPEVSEDKTESSTWSGVDNFEPEKAILSNKIKDIDSDVKIFVINFLLRNYGKSGYTPIDQRGIDDPNLYSRLNNDMVKAFYTNTPDKNKGEYIEDRELPHAFLRDGNIKRNEEKVASLIGDLFNR